MVQVVFMMLLHQGAKLLFSRPILDSGSFQRIQTYFSVMSFIFSYPATQPDSLIRQLIKSLAMPDTID